MDVERGDDPILYLLGYGVVIDREKALVTIVEPPPPSVWVARCVWPGTAREVRAPDFPRQSCVARSTATVREPPTPPGRADLIVERAGWLQGRAEGPGWLVTTQPWYPGWTARVDGAPAAVEAVDGALVGVQLPPGEHAITLDYRPAGLERGLLISGAVGLVLLVSWWSDRRGGTRSPHRRGAG